LQVNFGQCGIRKSVLLMFKGYFFELIGCKFYLLAVFVIKRPINVSFGVPVVQRDTFVEVFKRIGENSQLEVKYGDRMFKALKGLVVMFFGLKVNHSDVVESLKTFWVQVNSFLQVLFSFIELIELNLNGR
jgi:hypothetical protein